MPSGLYEDYIVDHYRENPGYALTMLNAVLEDGEPGELGVVLRQLTKAFGSVPPPADAADPDSAQLSRALLAAGNPALSNLTALLKSMGLRLAAEWVKAA